MLLVVIVFNHVEGNVEKVIADGFLHGPYDCAINSQNELFVRDRYNNRMVIYE